MIQMEPLGRLPARPTKAGGDRPGAVASCIEPGPGGLPDALAGLDESSREEVILDFDGVDIEGVARRELRRRAWADPPMCRNRGVEA